jgi:hypothetical protein
VTEEVTVGGGKPRAPSPRHRILPSRATPPRGGGGQSPLTDEMDQTPSDRGASSAACRRHERQPHLRAALEGRPLAHDQRPASRSLRRAPAAADLDARRARDPGPRTSPSTTSCAACTLAWTTA